MNHINSKSISFSISKMLRTPVLGKGRKVKHHYKTFRTVLSMMVEFNLARQVLGVKHKLRFVYNFSVRVDCSWESFTLILLLLLCQALIYILRNSCLRQRHLMMISDIVSCMRLFSNPIIMMLRRPHERRNLLIYSLWLIKNMFNLKKYNYDFRLQN